MAAPSRTVTALTRADARSCPAEPAPDDKAGWDGDADGAPVTPAAAAVGVGNRMLLPPPVAVISMHRDHYLTAADRCARAGFPVSVHMVAVNGRDPKQVDVHDRAVVSDDALYQIHRATEHRDRESSTFLPSKGAIGCYLSHVALWRAHAAGVQWDAGRTYTAASLAAEVARLERARAASPADAAATNAPDDGDEVLEIVEDDVGWKRTGSYVGQSVAATFAAMAARGTPCDLLLHGGQRIPPSDELLELRFACGGDTNEACLPLTPAAAAERAFVGNEPLRPGAVQASSRRSAHIVLRALRGRFWGTEAYALTRRGARALKAADPLPIHQQVDAWLGTKAWYGFVAAWYVYPTWAYQVPGRVTTIQLGDGDSKVAPRAAEVASATATGAAAEDGTAVAAAPRPVEGGAAAAAAAAASADGTAAATAALQAAARAVLKDALQQQQRNDAKGEAAESSGAAKDGGGEAAVGGNLALALLVMAAVGGVVASAVVADKRK